MKTFRGFRFFISSIIIIAFFYNASAQDGIYNESGEHNGYTYLLWQDKDECTLTLNDGATFEFSWGNSSAPANSLARVGVTPGTGEENIEFAADFQPDGTTRLCVHGWFMDGSKQTVEYSIIENYVGDLGINGDLIDSIDSDGSKYRIYREYIYQHGILNTYYQHTFVREDTRNEGIITFNNHYNKLIALNNEYGNVGELNGVAFAVDAYQSTGYCNVYTLNFTVGFPEDPDVVFTSIQENDEFSIGDEVLISSDITPKQGTIEKVEFFAANKIIGEKTQTPYEILWLPDSTGSIPITIIATDTEGWDTKKTTTVIVKDQNTENPAKQLTAGWNIIGYIKDSAPIENALAGIWDNVEVVKDLNSFYQKGIDNSLNSLNELSFGHGYLIKVSEDCILE